MPSKIVLLGDSDKTKLEFLNMLFPAGQEGVYVEHTILGVEIVPVHLGEKHYNFWIVGGVYQGLMEGYLLGADLAIVFTPNYVEMCEERGLPFILFDEEEPLVFINHITVN